MSYSATLICMLVWAWVAGFSCGMLFKRRLIEAEHRRGK